MSYMPSIPPPMQWLGKLAQMGSIDLSSPNAINEIIAVASTQIESAVAHPTRLYGHRVEAMFAYVLAGLEKVVSVTQEDSGIAHVSDKAASPPDFRVRLTDGREIFIEVKSLQSKNLTKKVKLKNEYLHIKQAYASAWDRELYFAFYWRQANRWILLKDQDFLPDGNNSSLTLFQAAKRSRMAELGDVELGTVPPLALHAKLTSKQVEAQAKESLDWTTASRFMTTGGVTINDPRESKLAWYMLRFGSWAQDRLVESALEDGSRLLSYYVEPEQWNPEQGFAMIGSLSGMISNAFRFLTQHDGKVSAIMPKVAIGTLGTRLPKNPSGKDLKLWRIILTPNLSL